MMDERDECKYGGYKGRRITELEGMGDQLMMLRLSSSVRDVHII